MLTYPWLKTIKQMISAHAQTHTKKNRRNKQIFFSPCIYWLCLFLIGMKKCSFGRCLLQKNKRTNKKKTNHNYSCKICTENKVNQLWILMTTMASQGTPDQGLHVSHIDFFFFLRLQVLHLQPTPDKRWKRKSEISVKSQIFLQKLSSHDGV